MKKTKIWLYALLAVMGAMVGYIGGFVLVGEKFKMLSGLCIGLGSAAFALGIGNFIGALIISETEYEEITRRKNIEVNDERNTRIREKVGTKINQIVVYIITAIVLALGFMGADAVIIMMISSVLLLQLVLAIVLTNYYSKRM